MTLWFSRMAVGKVYQYRNIRWYKDQNGVLWISFDPECDESPIPAKSIDWHLAPGIQTEMETIVVMSTAVIDTPDTTKCGTCLYGQTVCYGTKKSFRVVGCYRQSDPCWMVTEHL